MKTKIVYILISDFSDTLLEQALLSIFSSRQNNPDAIIEVVVDADTEATLIGKRSTIKQLVNTIIQVDVPEELSKMQRSRYIKTKLRELVTGNYLYVDIDTVIIGDLSSIDSIEEDIAMAYDANSPFPLGNTNSVGDKYINKYAQLMGWSSLAGHFHYNSGVIFAKESIPTKKIYRKWHENWLECSKCGVNIDELALTKANKEVGDIIHRLDDTFNWQIQRHGCCIPFGTIILHYFNSDKNYTAFLLAQNETFLQIKENGQITDMIKYHLDDIDHAFAKVTYVISEEEYNLLQEQRRCPVLQIKQEHPLIFQFLNNSILAMSKFRALFANAIK